MTLSGLAFADDVTVQKGLDAANALYAQRSSTIQLRLISCLATCRISREGR